MRDLVDNYQPDLLYVDGALPFEDYGYSLVAHLYNTNAKRNGGKTKRFIRVNASRILKTA